MTSGYDSLMVMLFSDWPAMNVQEEYSHVAALEIDVKYFQPMVHSTLPESLLIPTELLVNFSLLNFCLLRKCP